MTVISLEEAGKQISRLVHEAQNGEEVILTDADTPVAKLTPIPPASGKPRRKAGSAKGLILYMADDFDAPLDDFKEYME